MTVERMNPLDASFLHLEDAVSHMHVASVAIFEGPPPDYVELVEMIRGRMPLAPRCRQRAQFVPLGLGRPVWVDDPHFDLEYHLRHTALPKPGDDAQLRRLVGRVMGQQLDRHRPLWEIWMVEGLEGGRWAMLSKAHHAMIDGVSGVELMGLILDASPEPAPSVDDHWAPGPTPSSLELTAAAVVDLARSPYEQLRAVRAATRAPRQLLDVAKGMAAMARSARPSAASVLNGPLGPHRRYAWTSATTDQVRTVRSELGGTFNDVVLAAITSGYRDLLLAHGEPVDRTLRTLVPVSVRARDASGRVVGDGSVENKVSAMFAELPVGVDDAAERLAVITDQMQGLKESKQAVAGEALVSMSGFAPSMLLGLGMRAAARLPQRAVKAGVTNVPGPQFPLYAAGRRMLEVYPYVPLFGQVRVAVAIFSYDGQVNIGVTGDADHVPDLEVVVDGIDAGMAELLAAATA